MAKGIYAGICCFALAFPLYGQATPTSLYVTIYQIPVQDYPENSIMTGTIDGGYKYSCVVHNRTCQWVLPNWALGLSIDYKGRQMFAVWSKVNVVGSPP